MTIQSIDFSNLDLAYIIHYEDGHDVKMLGSNDPAMDSLTDARAALTDSVTVYAGISEYFNVSVKKVIWGKEKVTIKFTSTKIEGWPKRQINSSTAVTYYGKRENSVEPIRAAILDDTENLQKEVEKYLMGQRMQKELPFQE